MQPDDDGTRRMHGPEDEGRHPPGGPGWQESVLLHWWDERAGIGGFHRIGHEIVAGGARANLWHGVMARDGRVFRRYLDVDAGDGPWPPDRFECTHACSMRASPRVHWTLEDPQCRVELEAQDFHTPFDPFPPSSGTLAKDYASNHFEVSGRVTGRVTLDGQNYSIDGLGYRDHSWGPRNWATLLSHRWVVGCCGPDLSFGALAWHGVDGSLRKYGYVVRAGRILRATAVDIVTFMEVDALTHRGGEVTLVLEDGSTTRIRAQAVSGMVTLHHGIASVDELCTVEVDGRTGYCDFEITTNPRNGTGPVSGLVRATQDEGLSWLT